MTSFGHSGSRDIASTEDDIDHNKIHIYEDIDSVGPREHYRTGKLDKKRGSSRKQKSSRKTKEDMQNIADGSLGAVGGNGFELDALELRPSQSNRTCIYTRTACRKNQESFKQDVLTVKSAPYSAVYWDKETIARRELPVPPTSESKLYSRILRRQCIGSSERGWEINPRNVRLERRIGAGSFGQVWRGSIFGKAAAVKMLNGEMMYFCLAYLFLGLSEGFTIS